MSLCFLKNLLTPTSCSRSATKFSCIPKRYSAKGTVHRSRHPDITIPKVSVAEHIFNQTEKYADKVALLDHYTGKKLTHKDVREQSYALAASLQQRGLQKGEVVALYVPNIPEFAVVMLGVTLAGGIITSINPVYTAKELTHQLSNSGAKFMITLPHLVPTVNATNIPLQEIFTFGEAPGTTPIASLLVPGPKFTPVPIDPMNDLMVMPYSSGTTSLPKGVRLTHHNVVANICQVNGQSYNVDYGPNDSIIGLLPFFHIYGMTFVLLGGMCTGTRIVTVPKFEPLEFLKCMDVNQINVAHLAPPAILFLAKHPAVEQHNLSKFRDILCGAAPLGMELAETCVQRLKHVQLRQIYGMTEMAPVSHMMPLGHSKKWNSIGKLVANMEMKICDLDTGVPLPVGQRGELMLKGPNVMPGYHKNAVATDATFDPEGFLKTGDIGLIDEDGDTYVVDRCKELIKVKGFQVAPAELEDLLQSHPAVADCGVIGMKLDNEEAPKAFITLKPDQTPSPTLKIDIIEFAAKQSAPYKRIKEVVFVAQIPKSNAGKILRRELRDMHTAA